MSEKPDYVPGLAGIPAARSSVCLLDGAAGKLQYRGYPAEQLAEHCTFEEVTYLLLFGELPTRAQLNAFSAELARERSLKFRIIDVLKQLPESGHPMDALTAAVAVMGMFYAEGASSRSCRRWSPRGIASAAVTTPSSRAPISVTPPTSSTCWRAKSRTSSPRASWTSRSCSTPSTR